jgi:hypothetical protein
MQSLKGVSSVDVGWGLADTYKGEWNQTGRRPEETGRRLRDNRTVAAWLNNGAAWLNNGAAWLSMVRRGSVWCNVAQ